MGWYTINADDTFPWKYGDVVAVARASGLGSLVLLPRLQMEDEDGECFDGSPLELVQPGDDYSVDLWSAGDDESSRALTGDPSPPDRPTRADRIRAPLDCHWQARWTSTISPVRTRPRPSR